MNNNKGNGKLGLTHDEKVLISFLKSILNYLTIEHLL